MADPIDEALSELRGAAYAQVREWDAARMRLARDYEAADGEYLRQIHATLRAHGGLWQMYLVTRGLSYQEAMARIHLAEARQRVTAQMARHEDERETPETRGGSSGVSTVSQIPVLSQLVYTAEEARQMLRIGTGRMTRILMSGELPSIRLGSRNRRITRQALLDFLARQEAESQQREEWQA